MGAAANDSGFFYAIQIAPKHAPTYIKCGWSLNPQNRLRQHRTVAPTAIVLKSWPCLRGRESMALAAVNQVASERLGPETFDVADPVALTCHLDQFFENGSALEPLPRMAGIHWPPPDTRRRETPRTGFGAKLKLLRHGKFWSQRELAEMSGLTVASIKGIEAGRRTGPRPSTIRALAAALGVDASVLTSPD